MIPDTTLSTPCRCCHGFCAAAKSYFAGQFKIGGLWNQPSRGSAWNDVRFCMECGDSRKSIRWFMNCGVNSSAMRERFVATMSRSVVEILFLALGILNSFSTSFGQTIFFRNWTNCSSKAKRPFDTECPRIYMVTRPDSGETRNILTTKPTVFQRREFSESLFVHVNVQT